MRQPSHNQLVATNQLHAVNTEIHARLFWSSGDNQRPGNKRANIPGPAGLNRKFVQVDVISIDNNVLAGRTTDGLGPHVQYFLE